jgi:hypothetical protein
MGLDQYAYVAAKAGQRDEYWNQHDLPEDQRTVNKPREIAYWRKHPNLQGWMERLWREKGRPGGDSGQEEQWGSGFNGVELELTWEDIDRLEQAIRSGRLPDTRGFFFGEPSDDYYREQDLEFCRNARADLFCGLKVFYNSSW